MAHTIEDVVKVLGRLAKPSFAGRHVASDASVCPCLRVACGSDAMLCDDQMTILLPAKLHPTAPQATC